MMVSLKQFDWPGLSQFLAKWCAWVFVCQGFWIAQRNSPNGVRQYAPMELDVELAKLILSLS